MDKKIRIKGDGWSIAATAINVPSQDVAIDIKINGMWTQDEVRVEGERIRELITEWWEDSRIMSPKHFICDVIVPVGYEYKGRTAKCSMYVIAHLNVLTRNTINRGSDSTFKDAFGAEIDRLSSILGVE
jgi:hypothetical protein